MKGLWPFVMTENKFEIYNNPIQKYRDLKDVDHEKILLCSTSSVAYTKTPTSSDFANPERFLYETMETHQKPLFLTSEHVRALEKPSVRQTVVFRGPKIEIIDMFLNLFLLSLKNVPDVRDVYMHNTQIFVNGRAIKQTFKRSETEKQSLQVLYPEMKFLKTNRHIADDLVAVCEKGYTLINYYYQKRNDVSVRERLIIQKRISSFYQKYGIAIPMLA